MCSDAREFVNPSDFSVFLHECDPKYDQSLIQVLKLNKEDQMKPKNTEESIRFHLRIQQNHPMLKYLLDRMCEPLGLSVHSKW